MKLKEDFGVKLPIIIGEYIFINELIYLFQSYSEQIDNISDKNELLKNFIKISFFNNYSEKVNFSFIKIYLNNNNYYLNIIHSFDYYIRDIISEDICEIYFLFENLGIKNNELYNLANLKNELIKENLEKILANEYIIFP